MIAPGREMDQNKDAGKSVKASALGMLFWYLFWILIIPLIAHIIKVNKIKRMRTKISEAESGIDIQLKRRRDTLVKLLDAVKSNISFEQSTYSHIVNMRMGGGVQQMMENDKLMNKTMKNIGVQLENYPNLKTSDLVQNLMTSITDIEEDISASRRIYNSNASYYNQYIIGWPNNVIAKAMKAKTEFFFEITEEERADVNISF
ncbi:LemA family protein [Spiroplasma culicicola]|uniref:LemA family protein n=1 Tax=Spiroplasma culicicola AES-1 TaxID=1276246 RepID=W6A7T5_9MOLU|nr:LemA family protein [Spiroplasma culicicola]AHI53051.1 LemA family protein [Spiroplasma culicicola AES-1]